MAFRTTLETADSPVIYARLCELIGESTWLKFSRKLRDEVRGEPILKELIESEHEIVLGLVRCGELARRGHLGRPDRNLYRAIAFAAQATSIIDAAPERTRRSLIGRVTGAIRNPEDMRAMRLEFAVATHFLHLGHEVAWPELDHSSRNDLFVRDLGRGLQLECKAFSKDIGRRVLQRDAVRFYGILKQQLHGVFRALTAGLVLVLTVPDRLPTAYSMKVQLAKEVRAQVLKGTSGTLSDGSDLRIDVFDTGAQSLLTSDGKPNRDVIDEISGVRNEHALVHTNGHGAVVLVVQSAKDDKKKDAILRRLETAAEQLDSRSPGVVVAGLDSLTAEELQDLSTEDRDRRRTPTVLRVTASDFLGSASAHVVGMVWLSRGDFVPREDGVSDQGAAYWFPRQDSLFWDGAFEHSFGTAKSS